MSAQPGMICSGFKGGIGTIVRKLSEKDGGYTSGPRPVQLRVRARIFASPESPGWP